MLLQDRAYLSHNQGLMNMQTYIYEYAYESHEYAYGSHEYA